MNKVELAAINKIVNSSTEGLFEDQSIEGNETNIKSGINKMNIKAEEKSALEIIKLLTALMRKIAQKQMTEQDLRKVINKFKNNEFLNNMRDVQKELIDDVILCGAQSNPQAAKRIQNQELVAKAKEEQSKQNKEGQTK